MHQQRKGRPCFLQWLRGGPWRRRLVYGVIIGMIITASAIVIAALPGIPPFKQGILSFADNRLSSFLLCKARVGAVSIDIRKGLIADNIVLADPSGRSSPIGVERLAVRIDLTALLRGQFVVRSITITGLSGALLNVRRGLFAGPVDIGRVAATVNNAPHTAITPSKPAVQSIYAERCTVSFVDSVANIAASETIRSLRLTFIRTDSIAFVMKADHGQFSSPVWSGGVRSTNVCGAVGPSFLLFSNGELQGDSMKLSVAGMIPFSPERNWNLTATTEAFVAGFAAIYKNIPQMHPVGSVKAGGMMSGTIAHPVLWVTLAGYGLQAGTVSADSLLLRAHYSDDHLRGNTRLWLPAGHADASVNADITHLFSSPAVGNYAITAAAATIDVHRFASMPFRWRHRSALFTDAKLYAAGSGLRHLPDTVAADIREVATAPGEHPVAIMVQMAGNRWNLTAAMEPDFRVSGNGRYTDDGSINGSLHGTADAVTQIALLFVNEGVRGSLTADALLSGTVKNPTVSATVTSTDLNWRDILVSKLWGRFSLRNSRLHIDSLHMEAAGLLANALQGTSLPGEFNGKAWIQADASGTFDALHINGGLQLRQFSYNRYHADTVSLQCQYADRQLSWHSFTVGQSQSAMLSSGTVSWAPRKVALSADCKFTLHNDAAGTLSTQAAFTDGTVEASVTAEGLDPAVLSPWFPAAQQLSGSLAIHGAMTGTTGNPAIKLSYSYDHPISNSLGITSNGDLLFTNNVATATVTFAQNGQKIPLTIAAHLPVSMDELSGGVAAIRNGATVTVSSDSVAYGGLLRAFAPSVKSLGTITLEGRLVKSSGVWGLSCSTHIANDKLTVDREEIGAGPGVLDLRMSGPLARPTLRFSLSGGSLEYRGGQISSYAGSGSIDNGMVNLDTLHVSCNGGSMEASARVPASLKNGFSFGNNARISATLAALPFGIVQPFVPDYLTINKGVITGRVIIKGAANGVPQASGTLSLRKGDCYVSDCDKQLGPLSADIDLKNDSLLLRHLQANWGRSGRITGSGWAVLCGTGISSAKTVVNISNVRLKRCNENLDLGIQTAAINLTKDSLFTITADLLLGETRFIQDFSLVTIGEQLNKRASQAPHPPNPLFHNVIMRITANLNGNLTFDSNLGKMLVDGSVTVAGRPDKPSIEGQIQVLNGFVYYLDRKFTITQGTLRQYDPQQINPSLTITATSRVSWYPPQSGKTDYDITLLITGDLSSPLITMSALPSLAQPQIISLLTLGTIQTGVGSDLGSRAGGALVSQQLAGFGTRKLARLLNVESVDLYGNVFDTASAGPQLSVTKQVSSRVAVTYKAGLTRLSQQMVQVSYRIVSFLYLEAETDQHAQGGIDLKFRYSR